MKTAINTTFSWPVTFITRIFFQKIFAHKHIQNYLITKIILKKKSLKLVSKSYFQNFVLLNLILKIVDKILFHDSYSSLVCSLVSFLAFSLAAPIFFTIWDYILNSKSLTKFLTKKGLTIRSLFVLGAQ